jgi:hypothetical protein
MGEKEEWEDTDDVWQIGELVHAHPDTVPRELLPSHTRV